MSFHLRRLGGIIALTLLLGGCGSPLATEPPTSGQTPPLAAPTVGRSAATQPAAPTTQPTVIAPASPPASLGPELKDFPSNYNPLTAQPASDLKALKLPAMLVSISNFPATARPQAGLSFAPYVFEFSITEGATRFLTVFYGDYPKPEVPLTGNCAVRMEAFEQTSDAIIGNRIWLDENDDGVQQFSEPGVGGVCVNLYDSGGNRLDQTTSDSNGYYGFNLPAGADLGARYVIEVVQPPGMLFTTFKAGGNEDLDSDVDPPSGRAEVQANRTTLSLDAGLVVAPGPDPTPDPERPLPKPEVGPVRSGRLLYADLAAMFQDSCLVYAFASPEVLAEIPYCSMVSHEIQGGGYMLPIERMRAIAKDNRKDDTVFDYSSNLYTQVPLPGGEPAKRLDVYFAYLNQSGWMYDPLMQSYLRYTDTTIQEEAGQLHPDTDRLTGRQLHFENIIILMTEHVVVTPTNLDIDLEQGGKGPAYLFRDGQIWAIRWSTKSGEYEHKTGLRRPIRWLNLDDTPAALKPGHTWVIIVTPWSPVSRAEDGGWKLRFSPPDGSK